MSRILGTNSDFAVLDKFELSTSKGTSGHRSLRVRYLWEDLPGRHTFGKATKRCSALVPLSIAAWVQIGVFATIVVGTRELLLGSATSDRPKRKTTVLEAIRRLMERAA